MITEASLTPLQEIRRGINTTRPVFLQLPLLNQPRVSVVIPALNEAENLPYVLPRIPNWVDEVLLVDGHSTDDTIEVARRLRPNIRIVQQEGCGKGAALRTGCRLATGDILVLLDADGSTDPGEIPVFVGALLAGADYVKGSRFLQGARTTDMPRYRMLGNGLLVVLANLLFSTHYTDITYGYNAVWRHHVESLALDIDGWPYEIISNIRAARIGLRVVEAASVEYDRIAGQAKLEAFSAGWSILHAILCERFKKVAPCQQRVEAFRHYEASGHCGVKARTLTDDCEP